MNKTAKTFVDSHVHIYDCFDLAKFFDAAQANFQQAAQCRGISDFRGVLLLTETQRDHYFERLSELAESGRHQGGWSFNILADDKCTLSATRSGDDAILYIIAGRQIVTAEKLEVLALATRSTFNDGQSLAKTLENISAQQALAVLPWAVGKWLGKRGKLIQQQLHNANQPRVLLGDNSGRPTFWRNPELFRQARMRKIKILPGSDPLPLPWEVQRVGRFGFILPQALSETNISQDLKKILSDNHHHVQTYGRLDRPDRFFRNQIALRMRK